MKFELLKLGNHFHKRHVRSRLSKPLNVNAVSDRDETTTIRYLVTFKDDIILEPKCFS